ncbi:TetR family transcriptional regulator C-terminal domain-containing protein [Allokutzneria sp. NRRL B-24872]|uniref:TetR family transcriptional regulator C-terminal domain-containing protein n=1 Tax=Allokutzneria sp. NRRL B-24872 TaxID=1137961 RepID=UPI000A38AFBD|nr:TetR family transcriptional regulator C-terminal domain-containing protein [Allokutzneria sp. NRRL B-24872]
MPKVIDPELRRAQVVHALLRLTAERGLDEVSVAKVAAAAGVSVGLVQHYFATKDEMLLLAFHTIDERFDERLRRWLEDSGQDLAEVPARSLVREALSQLMPLDDERADEVRVWLAFCARGAATPQLAKVYETALLRRVEQMTDALRRGRAAGEIAPGLDLEAEALHLLAFAEGLAQQALLASGHITAERVVDAVDARLGRVFTTSDTGENA